MSSASSCSPSIGTWMGRSSWSTGHRTISRAAQQWLRRSWLRWSMSWSKLCRLSQYSHRIRNWMVRHWLTVALTYSWGVNAAQLLQPLLLSLGEGMAVFGYPIAHFSEVLAGVRVDHRYVFPRSLFSFHLLLAVRDLGWPACRSSLTWRSRRISRRSLSPTISPQDTDTFVSTTILNSMLFLSRVSPQVWDWWEVGRRGGRNGNVLSSFYALIANYCVGVVSWGGRCFVILMSNINKCVVERLLRWFLPRSSFIHSLSQT